VIERLKINLDPNDRPGYAGQQGSPVSLSGSDVQNVQSIAQVTRQAVAMIVLKFDLTFHG
jgi:hypothetical protein